MSWDDLTPEQREKVRRLLDTDQTMSMREVADRANAAFLLIGGEDLPDEVRNIFSGNIRVQSYLEKPL